LDTSHAITSSESSGYVTHSIPEDEQF
jgi:hypothetical protein